MGCASCCKYTCYVYLAFLAVFLAPLAMYKPKIVALDHVQEWGLKGPYLHTLSDNMKGVYYLSGNQAPWNIPTSACSAEEKNNRTICRNGWKISQLMLLDTSYMSYDRAAGKIYQYAPALGISEHAHHKGGVFVANIFLLMRVGYIFDKFDPEFKQRSAELFEGMMKLYFFGMSAKSIFGMEYRVTAEDSRGNGAVIDRYTWIGGQADDYSGVPYDVPQKKSEQLKDFKYVMKRLMDKDGNIDQGVLAEMKKVYGENIVFLGA